MLAHGKITCASVEQVIFSGLSICVCVCICVPMSEGSAKEAQHLKWATDTPLALCVYTQFSIFSNK